jgi:hypothetical protein
MLNTTRSFPRNHCSLFAAVQQEFERLPPCKELPTATGLLSLLSCALLLYTHLQELGKAARQALQQQ